MSIETAESNIEQLLRDNWTATAIDLDNVNFIPKTGMAFVRLQIEWSISASAGPGRVRNNGVILLSVFTPAKQGTRLSATYIDGLREIYRKARIENMQFYPGYVSRVGERNVWFQRNLNIPFYSIDCGED